MGKILDFKTKYAEKIFAIDPAFSKQGHCGWAILNLDAALFGGNKNKPFIHQCGILQPFSSESSLTTMNDLCKKLVEIWKNDSGYTREPTAIIVERPVIYPGSPVRFSSIEKLNIFVGMLLRSLVPKFQISPSPNEWKGNRPKEETEKEIMSLLGFNDKAALQRDLQTIKTFQRHNLFDALGLGIYAGRVLNRKISAPEMVNLDEESRFYESLYSSVG
jgi:hypothetical protein